MPAQMYTGDILELYIDVPLRVVNTAVAVPYPEYALDLLCTAAPRAKVMTKRTLELPIKGAGDAQSSLLA